MVLATIAKGESAMLCCALGLAAAATIPAWRRMLLAAGRRLVPRDAALFTSAAVVTAAVIMFAAHAVMHRGDGSGATAISHLCIAPSLRATDLRLADRPARRPDRQIF
jgi:hypothetical protein